MAATGLVAHRDARRLVALALSAVLGAPLVAACALLAVSLGARQRHAAGLLFLLLTACGAAYVPVKASELGGR